MIRRQVAAAILIIAFLVSIALAASASPLRAQNSTSPNLNSLPHQIIGTVSKLAPDQKSFQLTLRSGKSNTVMVSSTPLLSNLKIGARVAVVTLPTSSETIEASNVLPLPKRQGYRIARGVATDITDHSFVLALPGHNVQLVSLTPNTVYSSRNHRHPQIVTSSELTQGAQVVVVGSLVDSTLTVKLVHIIKK